MDIKYDLERIKSIVTDIAVVTGVCMGIYDRDGTQIYMYEPEKVGFCRLIQDYGGNLDKCCECDSELLAKCAATGKWQSHVCHAGLTDTAVPLTKDGIPVGYLMIGRLRPDSVKIPEFPPCSHEQRTLENEYKRLSYLTSEQLEHLVSMLRTIFIDSAITVEYGDAVSAAVCYIGANLAGKLDVATLCEKCYVSKNRLYELFMKNFGMTVNEYITVRRCELAAHLLAETDASVKEISERAGYSDVSYFCKVFTGRFGMSPKNYRKNCSN